MLDYVHDQSLKPRKIKTKINNKSKDKMHKPIAFQREKGVEIRTLLVASFSVLIVVVNVVSAI